MPKIAYIDRRFNPRTLEVIVLANGVIKAFVDQGFDLTLRQLYYQMIARDLFPGDWIDPVYNRRQGLAPDTKNTEKSYKKFGDILNNARLAGLVDWEHIVDRTRNLQSLGHWGSPESIIYSAEVGYRIDLWKNQPYRLEVWVEKDALMGVFAGVCESLDVPYFATRGYNSQSETWLAARRFLNYEQHGQTPVILHFGDHDPSGIDMTRDLEDRMRMFLEHDSAYNFELRRLALNWDQVEQYGPPANPAKLTDSRADGYIARFGDDSWELDALDPRVLVDLIQNAVNQFIDQDTWREDKARMEHERLTLRKIRENWGGVSEYLNGDNGDSQEDESEDDDE